MRKTENNRGEYTQDEGLTVLEQDEKENRIGSERSAVLQGKDTEHSWIHTELPGGEEDRDNIRRHEKAYFQRPCIKRLFTGEVVPITKSGFIIGRKDGIVDYSVSHNQAISRLHATIVVRDGTYYICDLGAKNRTFVNGKLLPLKGESEIVSGDVVKLANEDFLVVL